MQSLKRLNLADNAILVLVQRVFYHLNKLKYLDLSENPLAELPPDVFQDITVCTLYLQKNTICYTQNGRI